MKECTILIPVYNVEEYDLINAFKSINQQTARDRIRVFLWDDGSTKPLDYRQLAEIYMPGVAFSHSTVAENHGVGNARTRCMQNVKTPYFYWLDSDDVIVDPRTLEMSIDFLNSEEGQNYDGTSALMEERPSNLTFYGQGGLWGLCGRMSSFQARRLYSPNFQYVEDGFLVSAMHVYEFKIYTLPIVGYEKREAHLSAHYAPFWSADAQYMDYYCLMAGCIYELTKWTDPNSMENLENDPLCARFKGRILGDLCNLHEWNHILRQQMLNNGCSELEAWQLSQYYIRTIIALVPDSLLYNFYLIDSKMEHFDKDVHIATADQLLRKDTIWDPYNKTHIALSDLERIVKNYLGTRWYKDSISDTVHDYPPQRAKHYPWYYTKLFDN